MTIRTATFSANQQLVNTLMRTQKRMNDTQMQISSEQVSQSYEGIAPKAERLISIENSTKFLNRFVANNDLMDLDIKTMDASITSIETTIKNFKTSLASFKAGSMTDQALVKDIQELAFSSMVDIEASLNIDVGGKFLFSGASTKTVPVDMGLSTVNVFQSKWTGDATTGTTFPITEATHINMKLQAQSGHPVEATTAAIDATVTNYGNLAFNNNYPSPDTIVASTSGALSSLPVGSTITIAGDNNVQVKTSHLGPASNATATADATDVAVDGTTTVIDLDTIQLSLWDASGTQVLNNSVVTYNTGDVFRGVSTSIESEISTLDANITAAWNSATGKMTVSATDGYTVKIGSGGTNSANFLASAGMDTGYQSGTDVSTALTAVGGRLNIWTTGTSNSAVSTLGVKVSGNDLVFTDGTDTTTVAFASFKTDASVNNDGSLFTATINGMTINIATTGDITGLTDTATTTIAKNPITPNNGTFTVASNNGTTITVADNESLTTKTAVNGLTIAKASSASDGYGALTINSAAKTITALNAGSFANVPVGSTITIAGNDKVQAATSKIGSTASDALIANRDQTDTVDVVGATAATAGDTLVFSITSPTGTVSNTTFTLGGETFAGVASAIAGYTGIASAAFDTTTGKMTIIGDAGYVVQVKNGATPANSARLALTLGVDLGHQSGTEATSVLGATGGRLNIWTSGYSATKSNNLTATVDGSDLIFSDGNNTTTVAWNTFKTDSSANSDGTIVTARINDMDINIAVSGTLTGLSDGASLSIAKNPVATNNGDYTVTANTGTVLTVSGTLVDDGPSTVTTVTVDTSYYSGDDHSSTHKVAKGREFTLDVNAIDPSFEKAIRAMSIIAQGVFGTTGGLDKNTVRVADAQHLLDASLTSTVASAPPYGTEKSGNINSTLSSLAFKRILIEQMNKSHMNMISFLDQRVIDVEQANPLETITRLLNDETSLKASYEAMSRIRSLSLTNFL